MSQNPTQPTAYDIGFFGTPEAISILVKKDRVDLIHVLKGALDAYAQENRAENIQYFLAAFMSEKVKDIWYGPDRQSSGQNYWMGYDCQNVLTKTLTDLIEANPLPIETLDSLTSRMTSHERNVALHMLVVSSTWHDKMKTLETALTVGGTATGNDCEYAVYIAADKKNTRALDLLHENGVSFEVLKKYQRFSFGDTNYVAIYAARQAKQEPPVSQAPLPKP